MQGDFSLDLNVAHDDRSLENRIAEFKADPERMRTANEFVNEVLERAQKEAIAKRNASGRSSIANFGDTKAAIRQLPTRARGFMSRVFQAICNCTKTGGPFPFPTPKSS